MKQLQTPPTLSQILEEIPPERLSSILTAGITATPNSKYHHWEKLKHLKPPEGLSSEEWWAGVKFARLGIRRELPLKDASGVPFTYSVPDPVQELLPKIDQKAAGQIAFSDEITNPETRDRYIFNSLIEESITSSQLEGASTTRQVAADMLRSGRKPTDKSEKMILNNFLANRHIRTFVGAELSTDRVLELHKILTTDTLDNPDAVGQLQAPSDERVAVVDNRTNQILHNPPPARQLRQRLKDMCKFANAKTLKGQFLHPILRAIMLHFWLAYDHPFEDGNGRTARALFYWSMLSSGYWLFEFISISTILKTAFAQYGKSYLYAESDENDATYFIIYQLEVMVRAIKEFEGYIEKKVQQIHDVEKKLRRESNLNYRQLALLGYALRHPNATYTIKSHRVSHNVAYATARSDLLNLATDGLLIQRRIGGKTLVFLAPPDLDGLIQSL